MKDKVNLYFERPQFEKYCFLFYFIFYALPLLLINNWEMKNNYHCVKLIKVS